MDAVEFLKKQHEICEYYLFCESCPLNANGCVNGMQFEEIVKTVENWHPYKTRQAAFLEVWPHARIAENDVLSFCPKDIDSTVNIDCDSACIQCRRRYWLGPVEE